jgi:CBS domain-containing protein
MAEVTAESTDVTRAEQTQVRRTASPPLPEARPRGLRRRPVPGGHLDELTARDLMTPGVIAIVEDASLRQGFRSMVAHRKHAILVLGRTTGHPLGWITDRGLLSQLEGEHPLTRVCEAITEDPVSVTPGTTAREMAIELSRVGTTHLLVVPAAGQMPEGVVSALDLVGAATA